MITPLLQTKLYVPPIRNEVVRRPRLLDLVVSRPHLKLVLIAAPAGFGKTTLASCWLTQARRPVAWVSLDEGENDLRRFLLYVVTALHQVSSEVGQTALGILQSAETLSSEAILAYLINDLAEARAPLVLALDDYHLIGTQEVHDALTFLLDNLPPRLQIVLISRTEPPLPLARLRSRHELLELNSSDLRFTWSETEAFLNKTMRLGLSSEQITELESRTEGWITGLQLIALSIRNAQDANRLIQGISGDDRYIADYLVDEVISRQPASIQRFLLRTSILARMSADLCNAVMECEDSQQILDGLERANLFVLPLDNTRTWYRYHHLFAELLQHRLVTQFPAECESLHRRAAQWLFAHRMAEEAVEHALQAADFEAVTGYLQSVSDDEFLAQGRFRTYLAWMARIPDKYLLSFPKLILYRVFQLWEMQHLDDFHRQLAIIEQILGPIPDNAANLDRETAAWFGILSVIKGVVSCGSFAIEEASESMSRALRLLPPDFAFWRNLALGATGFCLRMRGRYSEAEECFARVVDFAKEAGLMWLSFQYGIARAQVCLARGKLQTALHTCEALLALDAQQGHQLPFAGVAYTMMGELLYLCGELVGAEKQARRGLELVTKDGDARHVADSYFTLARIHIARGALPEAVELMDRMMIALGGLKTPQSALTIARAYQASVWITCDEFARAAQWFADQSITRLEGNRFADVQGLPYFGVYCTVYEPFEKWIAFVEFTKARYELARGNAPAAIELVDQLLAEKVQEDDVYVKVQLLILKAQALHAVDTSSQPAQTLLAAVRMFAPEPFRQLWLNQSQTMGRLLEHARELLQTVNRPTAEEVHVRNYITQTLSRAREHKAPRSALGASSATDLSPREIEVLVALSRGISYGEMTDELMISRNTVKTYLKRIYSKLEVANRLQAVNRAKELGLLAA